MVLKILDCFGDGKKLNVKWQTSKNHRRFSLRCLSQDVIPVSIRLKSNIKMPKGLFIIKRVERSLLNERIRSVNNTINMLKIQKDTCINQIKSSLDEKTMEGCENFFILRRKSRHLKTLERPEPHENNQRSIIYKGQQSIPE